MTVLVVALIVVEVYRERKNKEEYKYLEERYKDVCDDRTRSEYTLIGLTNSEFIKFEVDECMSDYVVTGVKAVSDVISDKVVPHEIIIKTFPKCDDPDFALLLAQELCDKLNEK